MANRYLHRWEYDKPRMFEVLTASVIERGDMVWQDDGGDILAASGFTWDTDLETTQRKFQRKFVGIARQQSASGDTDDVRVGMDGVYELDCDSATFETLDKMAPAKASGNALEDQKVVSTNHANCQIGNVAKRVTSAATTVEVDIGVPSGVQTTTSTTTTTTTAA